MVCNPQAGQGGSRKTGKIKRDPRMFPYEGLWQGIRTRRGESEPSLHWGQEESSSPRIWMGTWCRLTQVKLRVRGVKSSTQGPSRPTTTENAGVLGPCGVGSSWGSLKCSIWCSRFGHTFHRPKTVGVALISLDLCHASRGAQESWYAAAVRPHRPGKPRGWGSVRGSP